MKTLEQKLAELSAKHEQDKLETTLEHVLEEALPGIKANSFASELYGREASVTIKTTFAELPTLLKKLPKPENACKLVTYATSFMTKIHADTVCDDKVKSQEDIFPYFVQLDANDHSHSAEIHFYAFLKGHKVEFTIETHLMEWRNFFRIEATRKDHKGGFSWRDIRIVILDPLHNIGNKAHLASPIRWASGGNEYINRFTVYWTPIVENVSDAREIFAEFLEIKPKASPPNDTL